MCGVGFRFRVHYLGFRVHSLGCAAYLTELAVVQEVVMQSWLLPDSMRHTFADPKKHPTQKTYQAPKKGIT